MMHETTDKKWFDDLILELRLRQVHGSAIGDTVASAQELLADTGQPAEEAFGPARAYAAALELPTAPQHEWVRRALWPALLGLLAFLVFNQAVVSAVRSEQMLVSPLQLALVATPVVLIALLPLYLAAAIRRIWVLITLSAICALAGLLSGVAAPTTQAEAWLTIDPLPWLIVSALTMVVLSIMNTIRSSRPNNDDIPDPRSATTHSSGTGTKIIVLITNWLFPILALAMLGLAFSFR
ncbi:hypothetical protein [Arthrobacter globiformis]|uniref:Uncharacterized protein n=1 Tax=Arthrobacter globiformis TaxID=1665 RepID=A0A328HI21_ARTGO|nr:hypothetical protein [Arthrobacter globiformis]RAM38289.1 hypothetical protein DBZ45_04545 [Arthrobacter globiformis]